MVISPTVFVLGVTLLGNAVEKSRQEEKAAKESESSTIKKEIEEVEEKLGKAKKDGDTTEVYASLEVLKNRQKQTNHKIQEIKNRYNSINLINTVIYPSGAFLMVLFFNQYCIYLLKLNFIGLMIIALISEALLLVYGLIKLYRSLSLIEEISVNKKESEYYDQIVYSIKSALTQYEQDKKEEVNIEFIKKAFPLNVTCSTELEIDFRVNLKKGTILDNVAVWFYVPDGFDLIRPSESESWRQPADFIMPNIRTVRVIVGKISIGPFSPRSLKIKTPSNPGKYSIRYSIKGDGYDGLSQDLKLIVG